MLSFDPEVESFVLVELGRRPQTLDQLEAEVAAQDLFDHVTVAATGA